MRIDNAALLADNETLAPDTAGTGGTSYSSKFVDRSDGVVSPEITGDLGNGRPITLNVQLGLVDDAGTASGEKVVAASKDMVINLISGDKLSGTNVVVGTTNVDGSDVVNRMEVATVKGNAKTTKLPGLITVKIPPKRLFGRYLQLEFVSADGHAEINNVTAYFGSNTSDAQFYYRDRSSIV